MARIKKEQNEVVAELQSYVKNFSGNYDQLKELENVLLELAEQVSKKAEDKKVEAYLEAKAKCDELAANITEEEVERYQKKRQMIAERTAKAAAARAAKKAEA